MAQVLGRCHRNRARAAPAVLGSGRSDHRAVICLGALQGLAFVAPGFLDLALLILVGLEGVVAWLLRLSSYAS